MSQKTGDFFSMGDGEQKPREKRQNRSELENLRGEFMDRARQFMDDSALGEGRKVLQNLINKVQGKEAPEEVPAEATDSDADWEGEEYDDDLPEPEEELDWSRPEYIHAGYAKPGTKYAEAKSLEDAQEESFNLRLGNLSGLLSRFGSEDANPEEQVSLRKQEMDKPFFREQMARIYAGLAAQGGTDASPALWLHPEVLTLLRAHQPPARILQFVMAALFAEIHENYLTQADQRWVAELMERAGFLLEPEAIQRQVDQTFLFAERVHRLYQNLLDEPLVVEATHFETYRENLAKLAIFEIAKRYDADPRTVIRTLAARWQEIGGQLQQALQAVRPIAEQYARFQQRKVASGSVFTKLRQAEEAVLTCHSALQELARDVELLKQITHLLEEEGALERLEQFQTELILPPEALTGSRGISLLALRERFVQEQLNAHAGPIPLTTGTSEALELSPIDQKRAISRAKEGEIKSLRLLEQYKAWRMQALQAPLLT